MKGQAKHPFSQCFFLSHGQFFVKQRMGAWLIDVRSFMEANRLPFQCDDPSSQALGVPVPCGRRFAGAEWRLVSCMSYTWASVLCLQRLSWFCRRPLWGGNWSLLAGRPDGSMSLWFLLIYTSVVTHSHMLSWLMLIVTCFALVDLCVWGQ